MNDGILSQDEIDALLNGGTSSSSPAPTPTPTMMELSDFERDAVGEIGNISMGTSATTLSTLLKRRVSITTPRVSITNQAQLQQEYPLPYVVIEVKYTEGISGTNMLVIKEADACIIADIMMGGDGKSPDMNLDEIKLSAVSEAMNQMMGSATTSLSSMFGKRIDISPPKVNVVDLSRQEIDSLEDHNEIAQIKFKMEIDDLIDSEIMQLIPVDAVKEMVQNLMGGSAKEASLDAIIESPSVSSPRPPQPETAYTRPVIQEAPAMPMAPPPLPTWGNQGYDDMPSGVKKGEQFAVQPVQFAPLHESLDANLPQNIGLIMDVPLDVTVELGKTRKTIKEVLEITAGSIIQLDKMAGEPVDLMVNGKLIAKGEVVVIDENYGIRITTILSPLDRMNKLQ
ncbi:MAG: flagellar motor switch phosphatase FliY [Firmicutes bacterium HGW-Firmicutes-15]|nr:MAG: flagellar motor switch phosphatase FliY [Firmicutes bacterium HGW-Firmicutes-15]